MSSTDSPLEILNPNPPYPHDTAQFEHPAVSLCCWPWCSSCLLLNKALTHTPTLRQLPGIQASAQHQGNTSALCWRRFQQEENAVITGYWNWTLVQNRIETCLVRLECDCCTLWAELPIHAGTGAWITGQGPKKWSSSESPCFHAFKIPKQKAMVILEMQPNTSQETNNDLYLIIILVTTLGQQWLILHTTDKKVSNTSLFL